MKKKYNTSKSKEYYQEALKVLHGGTASALHKAISEEYPIYIERGKGSKIYDVDGNEYIDYMGAFGPMLLGYCHPNIGKAVKDQIDKGSMFAAPTKSLNDCSKKITEIVPSAELIAFENSGTEANLVAYRIARAFTGRQKIIKFEGHYHGWSDELYISFSSDSLKMMGPRNNPWKTLESTGQSLNSADNIIVSPWNDLNILKNIIQKNKNEIAAVITEPIMCNCEVVFPKIGFLQGLREITAENNIVLIFDEIITGFRLALGGAQEYFDVVPDMCTFGKAVANGYPLAAVAGRHQIIKEADRPSGTFNGNPISIAACQATILELEKPGVYENVEKLTKKLTSGITEIAKRKKRPIYCENMGSIWQLVFGIQERLNDFRDTFKVDKVIYSKFRRQCQEKGIRVHPFRGRLYTSMAHTEEDIDKTLEVFEEVIDELL